MVDFNYLPCSSTDFVFKSPKFPEPSTVGAGTFFFTAVGAATFRWTDRVDMPHGLMCVVFCPDHASKASVWERVFFHGLKRVMDG